MPHIPGHNGNGVTLRTQSNQFINRRTGLVVPAGTPYHIHPDKGPMAGAQHNPNIPGGTSGHDFFDPLPNAGSNMGTPMSSTPNVNMSAMSTSGGGGGYRRGGRVRKMMHGGPHGGNGAMNNCPAGMMMQGGQCVPMPSNRSMSSSGGGGYRRGGRVRKMMHGGPHNTTSQRSTTMDGGINNGNRSTRNRKHMRRDNMGRTK